MKKITTEELKRRLDEGPVAVFDTRGDVEFEQGHIPGAKTAPLGSLSFRVAIVMNPESFVVVYSAGQGCDLAEQAARRLENLGLRNVHYYEPGLKGWQAAGFDAVPSVQPKTHAHGPAISCRHLVVDRETAYGGAFKEDPTEVGGAGG